VQNSNMPKKRGRPPKPRDANGNTIMDAGEDIAKSKSNGRNSPVIGDNGMLTKPGDNAKFLSQGLEVMRLPNLNLEDEKAVEKRIDDYFSICAKWDVKPSVTGLGMSLGLDRRRLWEINTDVDDRNLKLTTRARDSIKKAYFFMENLWENYMLNYKIHPTAGIFLAKNNFGYKDEQTYNLVPNQPLGTEGNPAEASQKYQKAMPGGPAAIVAEGEIE
jgi:hypothetical protein